MKKIFQEFKEFAFRGNVIDMAVGVVIGSAFTGIVTSIVNDLFTPLIALITGSVDFTALAFRLGEGENAPLLAVGNFIQTVINFLMVAICVFAFVKFVNKLRNLRAEEVVEDEEELVRTKYIEYTRLTEEDALVQADLLGHDFYVFRDMVTGNVHVIYHRKSGGYGILKPEEEERA